MLIKYKLSNLTKDQAKEITKKAALDLVAYLKSDRNYYTASLSSTFGDTEQYRWCDAKYSFLEGDWYSTIIKINGIYGDNNFELLLRKHGLKNDIKIENYTQGKGSKLTLANGKVSPIGRYIYVGLKNVTDLNIASKVSSLVVSKDELTSVATKTFGSVVVLKSNVKFVKLKDDEVFNYIKAYKIPKDVQSIYEYLNSYIPFQSLETTLACTDKTINEYHNKYSKNKKIEMYKVSSDKLSINSYLYLDLLRTIRQYTHGASGAIGKFNKMAEKYISLIETKYNYGQLRIDDSTIQNEIEILINKNNNLLKKHGSSDSLNRYSQIKNRFL